MMTPPLWALGAPDAEMAATEALLIASGQDVAYAMRDGQRVHPATAYQADTPPGIHPVGLRPHLLRRVRMGAAGRRGDRPGLDGGN